MWQNCTTNNGKKTEKQSIFPPTGPKLVREREIKSRIDCHLLEGKLGLASNCFFGYLESRTTVKGSLGLKLAKGWLMFLKDIFQYNFLIKINSWNSTTFNKIFNYYRQFRIELDIKFSYYWNPNVLTQFISDKLSSSLTQWMVGYLLNSNFKWKQFNS